MEADLEGLSTAYGMLEDHNKALEEQLNDIQSLQRKGDVGDICCVQWHKSKCPSKLERIKCKPILMLYKNLLSHEYQLKIIVLIFEVQDLKIMKLRYVFLYHVKTTSTSSELTTMLVWK